MSEKSGVYSFGVLVLEILSGKRYNRERENLIGSVSITNFCDILCIYNVYAMQVHNG